MAETHGGSGTKLFWRWCGMRARCTNPNNAAYHRYGGRGISVCDEWLDFATFREWALETGYREGLQIDRIDNNGHYSPENCRWATPRENTRNQEKSVWLTIRGERLALEDAAERFGVNVSTLGWRLRNCVPPEIAITPEGAGRHQTVGVRLVEYEGERINLSELARRTGINYYTLRLRLNKGMSVSEAVAKPIRQTA